jgi:chondroitin AC lyase
MVKTEGPKVVEISVADPNRELTKFHFSLSSRIGKVSDQFNAAWNAGTGMTDICVSLPEGVYQGQSVILSF